jgi:hypothetical protein
MATTINASTSAGLVSTADTSGVLQLQAANTTVLNAELGKALALQGATSTTGCGIAFPATQVTSTDANTLDDYEEGTWTPVLTDGTNNATMTVQQGFYTKIGNQVYLWWQVAWSGKGSMTAGNPYRISGTPFNAKLTSGSYYYNGLIQGDITNTNIVSALDPAVNYFLFFPANGFSGSQTVSSLSASGRIVCTITYLTT